MDPLTLLELFERFGVITGAASLIVFYFFWKMYRKHSERLEAIDAIRASVVTTDEKGNVIPMKEDILSKVGRVCHPDQCPLHETILNLIEGFCEDSTESREQTLARLDDLETKHMLMLEKMAMTISQNSELTKGVTNDLLTLIRLLATGLRNGQKGSSS